MPELITLGETMGAISPKENLPFRYATDCKLHTTGAESNTAIGLCKLGHSAGWLSAVGDDPIGEYVLASVRAEGVDVSAVKTDSYHRTGLMLKQPCHGETAVYYYRENSAAANFGEDDIPYTYLQSAKILHFTGIMPVLSETCLQAAKALVAFAQTNGKLFSFDPNIRRKLWGEADYRELLRSMLFASHIALPGLSEAAELVETDDPKEIVKILRRKGVRYIAVKNGAKGAWCADGKTFCEITPENCVPVDPIGAGDGFNAGFLCGLLEGQDIFVCGRMGAIIGAMATETYGDTEGYPSRKQLDSRLQRHVEIYR